MPKRVCVEVKLDQFLLSSLLRLSLQRAADNGLIYVIDKDGFTGACDAIAASILEGSEAQEETTESEDVSYLLD